MAQAELKLRATAQVKISKFDDNGNQIGVEEHTVELTEEEARTLWLSQQQA